MASQPTAFASTLRSSPALPVNIWLAAEALDQGRRPARAHLRHIQATWLVQGKRQLSMESFKPVIGQADLVTIARCPICSGTALYCLDRFMQADDRDELERLKCLGYQAESGALCQLKNVGDCQCRPDELRHYQQAQARKLSAASRTSSRPTLSLKRS